MMLTPLEAKSESQQVNQVVETPPVTKKICVEGRGNLGQRNNNPLNITYGRSTRKWVDERKAEINNNSHKFLKFYCEEDGWQAAKDLLKGSYSEISLEYAMRKWSGGGYGQEISKTHKKISEMTDEEFEQLVQNMAKREGWYAPIK